MGPIMLLLELAACFFFSFVLLLEICIYYKVFNVHEQQSHKRIEKGDKQIKVLSNTLVIKEKEMDFIST